MGNNFDKYEVEAVPHQVQISGAIPGEFSDMVGGNFGMAGHSHDNTVGASSLTVGSDDN